MIQDQASVISLHGNSIPFIQILIVGSNDITTVISWNVHLLPSNTITVKYNFPKIWIVIKKMK